MRPRSKDRVLSYEVRLLRTVSASSLNRIKFDIHKTPLRDSLATASIRATSVLDGAYKKSELLPHHFFRIENVDALNARNNLLSRPICWSQHEEVICTISSSNDTSRLRLIKEAEEELLNPTKPKPPPKPLGRGSLSRASIAGQVSTSGGGRTSRLSVGGGAVESSLMKILSHNYPVSWTT